MKNYLLGFLTFAFLCIGVKKINAQNFKNALPKAQVEQQLQTHLENSESIIQWKNIDDDLLWNTLANEGDLVSIGYKPLSESNLKENMHLINVASEEWTSAREKIINVIVEETQKKYGQSYTREVLMQQHKLTAAPNFKIRVFDKDIIRQVRQMPEVRYFEPATTPELNFTEAAIQKSDSGCSDHSNSLNSADYTAISPASRRSWHHDEHNIPCAWNNSNQGNGIWVAVMDTGLSSTQEKFNSDFTEGDSGGRVVETYNSYQTGGTVQTSNWQDQCGHGTAMAGLATAPRGYDNIPAGIAYRANLVSYRVTQDVLLNTGDEQDGVAAALYHAADDPRINVISMSIGHVFSIGQVEDAIIYATNKGKLIFAAAGTSTSITNFYPVIFPAWMPETVAVTGITDGSNRERCASCHDGPEVDFVVEMQRASNDGRTAVTTGVPSLSSGYVGGSSAATASMAGMAAVLWSTDTNMTRDQVLTRLIQSADNYPSRSNDFGWGAVDMCAAVSAAPFIPCAVGTTNEVTMEITNIVFPSTFDAATNNAEWVISFDGNPYFFENVDVNGDSGDPANFINIGECGSIPLLVDLGMTSCTQNSLPITIDIHEDDGATNDCNCDCGFFGSDDDLGSFNSTISFGATSFTIGTSEGNFVFSYALTCTSSMIPPAAGITVPQDTCLNAAIDVEFFATGGNGPYTASYSVNGGSTQTLSLSPNTGSIVHPTTSAGTTTYTLLSITDSNGCSQTLSQSESITIHPFPTIAATSIDPSTCLGNDGSIALTLTNVADGIYDISHSGGVFTGIVVTSGTATINGLSAGAYNDLSIISNTCESAEFPDVMLVDPTPTAIALTSDSPSCIGDNTTITASPAGMANYNFFIDANANGIMDSGEGVQSGTANTYSSTTFADGDIIGVVMTDGNSCESTDVIAVTIHPIPTIAATATNPTTCLGTDGSIALTLTNVPDGTYDIAHSGGIFTTVVVSLGAATISGVAAGAYDDLSIEVNECESKEFPDVTLVDPTPTTISLSSDSPSCSGDNTTITASPAGMANYNFFIDANANGIMDSGEGVQSGPANTYSNTTFADGDIIGVVMTDGSSCESTDVIAVTIHPIPTIAATATNPTTCLGTDGSIALTLTNVPDGTYDIAHSGGIFTAIVVSSGAATISGVPAGAYDDLSIEVNACESIEFPDVTLSDPASTATTLSSDAPRCSGTSTTVTASPAGMTNYSFFIDANANGIMDVGEVVQSGSSNTYSSTTFADGDLLGVVMTNGSSCQSTDVITVDVLPLDYSFSGSGGLTGVELGTADYETDGVIESTQRIDFSSIVDYDSAIEVNLLPGFETILGAQFNAFIDGCDNGGGGQL